MLFFRIRHEWTWWWLASCLYSLLVRCQLIWHHDSVLWRFSMVEIQQKSLNIIWKREYCLWITLSMSYAIIITMRCHLLFFIWVKSCKKKMEKIGSFIVFYIHFLFSSLTFLSKIYYFLEINFMNIFMIFFVLLLRN